MIKEVLKTDICYMKRDPMVWMILIVPLIMILGYQLLVLRLDFLVPYQSAAQYIFVVMTPFLVGMVLGFRMLDEKDEHMLSFYAVSPLGIKGYIFLRVAMTLVLAAANIIIISLFGLVPQQYMVFIGIQATLLAPFVFLVMGVLGLNKIQGMTLVKLMGLPFMLPVLRLVKENPLDKFFAIIPSYNLFQLIVMKQFNFAVLTYITLICAAIYLLASSFSNKCISDI